MSDTNREGERGASLVDAGLLVALIAITAISSMKNMGKATADSMCNSTAKVTFTTFNPTNYHFLTTSTMKACCPKNMAPPDDEFGDTGTSECLESS